ncbi:phage minor capsid protein [Limosilactobacillus fermentum]|uniref:phage minor capsid protein n=1 Tax=Limosilactobacillus fermentum TaxID=1613 RepID=UPI000FECDCD0|nr:phage minor capsid protein [Limosilactobacillus fermentum]QAR22380.1 capsid protein [Limosilactobacillus fermentum]
MGARERFEQAASKISDYYQALEGQIFNLIVNALKKGDYKHVDQNDVVMWQAQQLQKIGQLNHETAKIIAKKDGLSQQAVEDMIKFHGMAITDEIDDQLKRLTGKHIGVSNEVSMLVSGIAQQTWTDLHNNVNESLVSRNYGQSAVTKAYRQVLTESTTATMTGLMTHKDAVESAMYRIVDKGLPTNLTDKAGRNWSIEGYTRMVVNTTVNRAFNEVRLQRMSDFDMHLALMSSHPNSRPACAPIQGHVVNLVSPSDPDFDPHYDSIFNHGYGEPAGTQGINCRHILFPYEPGVSENHQPQYDPGEAIANGKLVQQQRARERAIRDAKKRLAVAEQLGDDQMVSQTKTLLRGRQAKLRDFIKETNAGRDTPLLTRDYAREKIVNKV